MAKRASGQARSRSDKGRRGPAELVRELPRRFFQAALDAARAAFRSRNRFGVHAFGIGPRIIGGRPTRELTLNAYVFRKESAPRDEVPDLTFDAGGARVRLVPNVVATGKRPKASHGDRPIYSGVHPGAAVTIRGRTPGRGALACLLGHAGEPTHALTAGHLFPTAALGDSIFAAAAPGRPVRPVGTLVVNFLDSSDDDVALVELSAAGIAMVNTNGPRITDFLGRHGSFQKLVRAFLATSNDFSREVVTGEGPMDALLSAPTRGTFWVRDTIPTDGEITNGGDSGTILCAGASNELAVGVCSGELGAHSVFVPFGRALELAKRHDDRLEIF